MGELEKSAALAAFRVSLIYAHAPSRERDRLVAKSLVNWFLDQAATISYAREEVVECSHEDCGGQCYPLDEEAFVFEKGGEG